MSCTIPPARAESWVAAIEALGTRLDGNGSQWRELRVTAEASEMVTVPRAELDALRAEVRMSIR